MSKRSKKSKSIKPFSFDNDNLDYQSIAKSWDLDMSTQSDDSISLPDDQSTNSSRSKESKKTKSKSKNKQVQNNDDIYVDNLANLGKVITVKELFIDTMDLEEINRLPCHILADYGKKHIELKQEKDNIINQLNLLGISNPEKVLYRVQKVPIYCKEKHIHNKINSDKNDTNAKDNNNNDNEQEEFIYGFIFQIICAIVLFSILGYVVYNRLYAKNK